MKIFSKIILTTFALLLISHATLLALMSRDLKRGNIAKASQSARAICRLPGLGRIRKISCLFSDNYELIESFDGILNENNEILEPEILNRLPDLVDGIELIDNFLNSILGKMIIRISGEYQEIKEVRDSLNRVAKYKDELKNITSVAGKLLGIDNNLMYTVFWQNNMELRATGGFMGSYSKMVMSDGAMADFYLQDIYVPDGQLKDHVNPPDPIAEAFKHGFWKLRDANWNPDFAFAAEKQIAWFLENGNENPGDIIVAVNFSLAQKIMEIIGPIYLSDYEQEVNANNFYSIAQYESESEFFPGSTQKKDFLGLVAQHMMLKLEDLSPTQTLDLLALVLEALEDKDIQIFAFDNSIQKIMETNGWAGKVGWDKKKTETADYQMIVESNLGANKANCCTNKNVFQEVIEEDDKFKINLKIELTNNSPVERPQPPKYWGGDYKNFLRVYLPQNAKVNKITLDDESLDMDQVSKNYISDTKIKEYGLWANVSHNSQLVIELNYELNKEEDQEYSIQIQKQSGAKDFYQEFEISRVGRDLKTKKLIDKDMIVNF